MFIYFLQFLLLSLTVGVKKISNYLDFVQTHDV